MVEIISRLNECGPRSVEEIRHHRAVSAPRSEQNVFEQWPDLVALVSVRVRDGQESVRAVWHHVGGDWVMSCDTVDAEDVDSWATVHVQHLVERDRTLRAVGDLPPGWAAFRDLRGMPWAREPIVEGAGPDDAGAVAVSVYVVDGSEPVRMVIHHREGDWSVLCGTVEDSSEMRALPPAWLSEHPELGPLSHSLSRGRMATRNDPVDPWMEEAVPPGM
jgi:hypothetical protein